MVRSPLSLRRSRLAQSALQYVLRTNSSRSRRLGITICAPPCHPVRLIDPPDRADTQEDEAMPHDAEEHWHEPKDWTQKAGAGAFPRPRMPYDRFMAEQEIPIVRDFGVSKVQNLPLKPWK